MVDNPAIHELNNIEVRGGDNDFQVVNIAGTSEDILLEYNDATEEWDIRGMVSDLDVADLEYEFALHQTEINEDREIPEGQGSVIAGPLTGTGEITGEGNLAVVDDVQDAVRNPAQENVDFNSNDATGISALEAESTHTKRIGSGLIHFAGDYPGGSNDERLNAALDEANSGDVIFLETGSYDSDRTIDVAVELNGGAIPGFSDRQVFGDWTLDAAVRLKNIRFDEANINLVSDFARITDCRGRAGMHITVSVDECIILGLEIGTVTFESGTSGGIINNSIRVSVTDNGDNEVGIVT